MPTLQRPGVYVNETQFATFVAPTPGQAVAAFVGQHSQGPLAPTVINSWSQFLTVYGGFGIGFPPSNLALAVFEYFGSGGTSCVVSRVVASTNGPVVSSLTFSDNSVVTTSSIIAVANPSNPGAITTGAPHGLATGQQVVISGVTGPTEANGTFNVTVTSPTTFTIPVAVTHTWVSGGLVTPVASAATLQISALNPGAWGNSIFIDILPGTDAATNPQTFTIVAKYGGSAAVNVVETWQNVTMTPGATSLGAGNYAPSVINNNSAYITVTDLGSLESGSVRNPKVTSSTQQMIGGSDGTGSPSSSDTVAALSQLDQFPDQSFTINIPGVNDSNTLGNAITYCENRGDCFLIVDPPSGQTPSNVVAFVDGLAASSFAAVYYPWIYINDPYSPTPGTQRLVPPGGFVAGVYAATDLSRGVSKTPAGLQSALRTAIGTERNFSNADLGTLNNGNVNAIRAIPNAGIVIWGGRTLSNLLSTRYISVRRGMIFIHSNMVRLTNFAVFEPNDFVLWTSITKILSQFLTSFWMSGGLFGNSAQQAFYVQCDTSNNTADTIQQGLVNVTIGVALERPAEFVVINLSQWTGGVNTSTTTP